MPSSRAAVGELHVAVDRRGIEVGMIELDFDDPGQCLISFLGLIPELAGHGHGSWLFAETLALAWRPQIVRVHVHTCSLDHPAALPAYLKAGFAPYKRAIEGFRIRGSSAYCRATRRRRIPLLEDRGGSDRPFELAINRRHEEDQQHGNSAVGGRADDVRQQRSDTATDEKKKYPDDEAEGGGADERRDGYNQQQPEHRPASAPGQRKRLLDCLDRVAALLDDDDNADRSEATKQIKSWNRKCDPAKANHDTGEQHPKIERQHSNAARNRASNRDRRSSEEKQKDRDGANHRRRSSENQPVPVGC